MRKKKKYQKKQVFNKKKKYQKNVKMSFYLYKLEMIFQTYVSKHSYKKQIEKERNHTQGIIRKKSTLYLYFYLLKQ